MFLSEWFTCFMYFYKFCVRVCMYTCMYIFSPVKSILQICGALLSEAFSVVSAFLPHHHSRQAKLYVADAKFGHHYPKMFILLLEIVTHKYFLGLEVVLHSLVAYLNRQIGPFDRIKQTLKSNFYDQKIKKLDPVGSIVRYEMMKLCTRSV